MVFNCFKCGVSVSSKLENCPHCKTNNYSAIDMMQRHNQSTEVRSLWIEKTKGTILSLVAR